MAGEVTQAAKRNDGRGGGGGSDEIGRPMSAHRGRSLRSGDWDRLWLGFPQENCAHKARQLEVVGMGGGSR